MLLVVHLPFSSGVANVFNHTITQSKILSTLLFYNLQHILLLLLCTQGCSQKSGEDGIAGIRKGVMEPLVCA